MVDLERTSLPSNPQKMRDYLRKLDESDLLSIGAQLSQRLGSVKRQIRDYSSLPRSKRNRANWYDRRRKAEAKLIGQIDLVEKEEARRLSASNAISTLFVRRAQEVLPLDLFGRIYAEASKEAQKLDKGTNA